MIKYCLLLVAACAAFSYAADPLRAVVNLENGSLKGRILFTQTEEGVHLEGSISGLKTGLHGFHVHEKGDLTGGCATAGAHFNPENKHHGAPSDVDRHVGDLGNVVADAQNVALVNFTDNVIALHGAHNIIGRAIVLHADPDDLGRGGFEDSRTTGHAGARLACGVIGLL